MQALPDKKTLMSGRLVTKMEPFTDFASRYVYMQEAAVGDCGVVESCFTKCKVYFQPDRAAAQGSNDANCLKHCMTTALDANLLIDRELRDYTQYSNVVQ